MHLNEAFTYLSAFVLGESLWNIIIVIISRKAIQAKNCIIAHLVHNLTH